jgi:HAD superfamily hydrolase (TIGR01509 family)
VTAGGRSRWRHEDVIPWQERAVSRVRRARPVLALDAMGVLYETGDDVGGLLVPFVQRRGSSATVAEIERAYLAASYGQIDAAAFWERLGLDPAVEDEYLAGHRLSAGVRALLEGTGGLFDSLCCLSNDVAAWSAKLRRRHALDAAIPRWFVSGEIGLRKPDPGIYRHMRVHLGGPTSDILFVDDRVANLDVARKLGLHTLLFDPSQTREPGGHPRIARLEDLLDPAVVARATAGRPRR